jgi:hypothetical protein
MRRFAIPLLLLLVAIAAMGCQQLFTTSLAGALARKELTLTASLSAADADYYAAKAKSEQNEQLATALVANLNAQIGSQAAAKASPGLAATAASSAVVASGAGTAIFSAVDTFISTGDFPTGPALIDLVTSIQAGATAGVITALKYLDPATGIADPSSVSDTVSATDYAIAAVVLAASALPEGMDPTTLSGTSVPTIAEFRADPDVVMALAIIGEAGSLATDQASQDLLAQLSDMMIPPVTP